MRTRGLFVRHVRAPLFASSFEWRTGWDVGGRGGGGDVFTPHLLSLLSVYSYCMVATRAHTRFLAHHTHRPDRFVYCALHNSLCERTPCTATLCAWHACRARSRARVCACALEHGVAKTTPKCGSTEHRGRVLEHIRKRTRTLLVRVSTASQSSPYSGGAFIPL